MYNSVAGTGSNIGAGSAQRSSTTSQQIQQAGTGALGTNSSNQSNDASQSNATTAPAFSLTKIHVHNEHFSKQDLVLDPKLLPNVKPGDLFEIYDPTLPKDSTKKLIIQWAGPDKNTPNNTPVQVTIQLTRTVAVKWLDCWNLYSQYDVHVMY